MSDTTPYATDWETKVAFMRAKCLTSAKWATVVDGSGRTAEVLTEAVCGPDTTPTADENPAKQLGPQEQERRARIAQRELVARSSGGPRLRLDEVR